MCNFARSSLSPSSQDTVIALDQPTKTALRLSKFTKDLTKNRNWV